MYLRSTASIGVLFGCFSGQIDGCRFLVYLVVLSQPGKPIDFSKIGPLLPEWPAFLPFFRVRRVHRLGNPSRTCWIGSWMDEYFHLHKSLLFFVLIFPCCFERESMNTGNIVCFSTGLKQMEEYLSCLHGSQGRRVAGFVAKVCSDRVVGSRGFLPTSCDTCGNRMFIWEIVPFCCITEVDSISHSPAMLRMIEMVLATDPTKHNVQMDDLKVSSLPDWTWA